MMQGPVVVITHNVPLLFPEVHDHDRQNKEKKEEGYKQYKLIIGSDA